VFTIRFPSAERREAFFSHPEYRAIRRELFEPSVSAITDFGQLRPSSALETQVAAPR
jgi:hypothetical protein